MKLPGERLVVYRFMVIFKQTARVITTWLLMADITKILVPIAVTLVTTLSRYISAGDRRFEDILSIPNSTKIESRSTIERHVEETVGLFKNSDFP